MECVTVPLRRIKTDSANITTVAFCPVFHESIILLYRARSALHKFCTRNQRRFDCKHADAMYSEIQDDHSAFVELRNDVYKILLPRLSLYLDSLSLRARERADYHSSTLVSESEIQAAYKKNTTNSCTRKAGEYQGRE
jgi:hypothetical protein